MSIYKVLSVTVLFFLFILNSNTFIFEEGSKTCSVVLNSDKAIFITQSRYLPFITYNINANSIKEVTLEHLCNEELKTDENGFYFTTSNSKYSFKLINSDSAFSLIKNVWNGLYHKPSEIRGTIFSFYKPGAFIGQKGATVDFYKINTCKSYGYFIKQKEEFLKMDYDNRIIVSCGVKANKIFN